MTRNYFITGGAGFIGSNYVHRLLERGENVTIYDNLSRSGAPRNVAWLEDTFGKEAFKLIKGDIRNADLLTVSAKEADVIVHLGGQVAVTTSVINPRDDFEANALGTFNALEAARLSQKNPIFIYSSTNKVYGGMDDVEIIEEATRWRYKDLVTGCPETQPLDFHSPYGCSKGTGDQYVRDYARIYGSAVRCLSSELYLWPASIRRGGSGLAGMDDHRRRHGKTDHDLRRWETGARCAACERFVECL